MLDLSRTVEWNMWVRGKTLNLYHHGSYNTTVYLCDEDLGNKLLGKQVAIVNFHQFETPQNSNPVA